MKFVRFLLVGAACFGLNLVVLYLGTGVFRMHYMVSMLLSIIAVTIFGWLLNRIFTFGSTDPKMGSEVGRYAITNLASTGVALLLMLALVDVFGINYLASSSIIAMGMALLNFLVHSRWSFGKSS